MNKDKGSGDNQVEDNNGYLLPDIFDSGVTTSEGLHVDVILDQSKMTDNLHGSGNKGGTTNQGGVEVNNLDMGMLSMSPHKHDLEIDEEVMKRVVRMDDLLRNQESEEEGEE
jgi:hypothetical protein